MGLWATRLTVISQRAPTALVGFTVPYQVGGGDGQTISTFSEKKLQQQSVGEDVARHGDHAHYIHKALW